MAKIERVLLPQNQQVLLPNGMISPAWYRFFVAMQKQFPELIGLAEQADETQAATATLDSRVGSLERNFLKDPVTNVGGAAFVVSGAYDQVEVQAIATRVQSAKSAINTIHARLQSSNIVRTS